MRLSVRGEELLVLNYPVAAGPDLAVLTRAEREVASNVLSGLSNATIARRRSTSVRTVANQVSSILRKLGVHSRNELAVLGANVSDA